MKTPTYWGHATSPHETVMPGLTALAPSPLAIATLLTITSLVLTACGGGGGGGNGGGGPSLASLNYPADHIGAGQALK